MRSIIDEIPYYKRPTEAEPIPLHHHFNDGGFHPECARCRIEGAGVKLLEEHVKLCKILGRFVVLCLQEDMIEFKIFAHNIKIEYRNGEPMIASDAIKQAEET